MLQKWIETTTNATWSILQQAIGHLPDFPCGESSESMNELLIIMYNQYCYLMMEFIMIPLDYTIVCFLGGLDDSNDEVDFAACDSLENAFVTLTSKVTELLLKKADFSTVRRSCLLSGAQHLTETNDAIMSSTDFNELFDFLAVKTPYWSWIDIRLLDVMAAASGIQAAIKLMNNYKKVIYGKKLKDVIPVILNKNVKEDCFTRIISKIDMNPDEITVAVLLNHQSNLEKVIMDISEGTIVLENVREGCIEVYWYIPNDCVDSAYENASKNCVKFYKLHLLNLKIGNYPLLSASGNRYYY